MSSMGLVADGVTSATVSEVPVCFCERRCADAFIATSVSSAIGASTSHAARGVRPRPLPTTHRRM